MEWLIKDVHDELKSWGYPGGGDNALILKSDGEPAIVAVREAIARFHGGQISPEQSATGESQSKGKAEVSGKVIRGMVKVFKDQLEYKTKMAIASSDTIMQWLVKWAAMIYSRFKVGADGKSLYERVRGRKCNVLVIPFGEKVMYRKLSETGEKKGVMESDWDEGIWLGHAKQSNEILVGTEEGTVRAWAVKRLTEEERWGGKMVKSIKGTPARPNPNGPGSDIPIRIFVPSSGVAFKEGPPARSDGAPKRTDLKKEDFNRHGYSDNCEGCRRLGTGGIGQRAHTAECRKRREKTLEKEGNPRWTRAEERFWDKVGRDEKNIFSKGGTEGDAEIFSNEPEAGEGSTTQEVRDEGEQPEEQSEEVGRLPKKARLYQERRKEKCHNEGRG